MGNIWIREFTGGLDARRLQETTAGGVLIVAKDGHINRGGEFEQRAAFVKTYTLPAGLTKGLAATTAGLFVFGAGTAPAGMPAGVSYQRLDPGDSATLSKVLSTTLFKGKLAVAAKFSDNDVFDYYDGTKITDWPSASGFATFLKTVQQKLYGVAGPNLLFSAVGDATKFDSGTGHGFIDMSTQATGSEQLTAIAEYQQYIAVFAGRTVQIEFVDPDPANNKLSQTLNNTGTIAPRSVVQFGDNDVFYLDKSGVRSLRARQTINVAFSSDTGNPIDDMIIAKLKTMTPAERADSIGIIEPDDGRLWMILKDVIYVFSYFTGSKVSAWSTYNPGFNVEDAVEFDGTIYLRSGDDIYAYGGIGDTVVYDDTAAEAWLPYLDANKPSQIKHFNGFDAAVRGTWEVSASFDPEDEPSDKVATISRSTFGREKMPGFGEGTHMSLRFKAIERAADGGPAKLSAAVIQHNLDDDED